MDSSYRLIKIASLFLLVCLLFLPFPTDSLWWREIFNVGHTALFFIVSLILYFKINTISKLSFRINKYFFVLVVGLLLGILIEYVQSFFQREASMDDLVKDFYGLMAGMVLVSATHQRIKWKKNTLVTGMVVFLFFGAYSFFQISWHYIQRSNAFPVIMAFDESWASSFLRFDKVELLGRFIVEGENVELFKLKFEPGLYSNVSMIEPEKNWSAYSALRFSVFSNNKQTIKLVLRIHDKKHNQNYSDRFNQQYSIQPGINAITVKLDKIKHGPEGRDLDMTNIAGIQLFLVNNKEFLFLDVSNFFLEQ